MGYIYIVINNVNQKKYVGQTTKDINKRWDEHCYDAINNYDDFYFHKAIRKYKPKNFTIKQLIECEDSLLDEKEIFYIEQYKTFYIYNQGYNLTRGGSGGTKVNRIEIIQQWNQGKSAREIADYFGFYIRTITDVLKQNGITQAEIYSRSMKYGARFREKKIFQYNLSGQLMNVYMSLNDMHMQTGYRKDYISAACRHTYPTANGYLWIYEDEEESIESLLNKIPKELMHPVLQYDSQGNFIAEYPSYNSAAEAIGCTRGLVATAAKTLSATAKGYFWKDKNDPIDIQDKINAFNSRYSDRKKQIVQMDLDGNIIATYESITAAAEALGTPSLRAAIGKVCKGKQKTSGGYRWAYAEA